MSADQYHQSNAMSGAGGAEAGAGAEATEIIQQMETLVDVESGLADAHLAVEADALGQDNLALPDSTGDQDGDDVEGFLDVAEEVEGALEAAIVPPPDQSQSQSQTQSTPSDAQVPGFGNSSHISSAPDATNTAAVAVLSDAAPSHPTQESSSSTGNPVSQTAVEAEHAIEAVNADIPVPILPEQIAEPAHDVAMETTIEEETSPMQIDTTSITPSPSAVQEQTQATISSASAPVEEEEEDAPRPRYDPSEPQEPAYVPSSSAPTPSYDPSVPQSEPNGNKYDPSEPQSEPAPAPVKYDPSEPQQSAPIAVDPRLAVKSADDAQATDVEISELKQEVTPANIPQTAAPAPASATQPPAPTPIPTQPYIAPVPSSSRPLAELPADITPESPSVVNNQQLVNIWRNSEFHLSET